MCRCQYKEKWCSHCIWDLCLCPLYCPKHIEYSFFVVLSLGSLEKSSGFKVTTWHTQLTMGWAYTLGVGVYIRKGCKLWNLSVSITKGVSHNHLAMGVIQ